MSSSRFTDKIAVLVNGQLTEYGTHDELIKQKGTYAELYSMQEELYKEA